MTDQQKAAAGLANLEAKTIEALLITATQLQALAGPKVAAAFCERVAQSMTAHAARMVGVQH